MRLPTVARLASSDDPRVQAAAVRAGSGHFSHDDDLPLRIRTKRKHWIGRTISVTTTEQVYYRDAIQYIAVPAGFTYDLASIPRAVWCIVSPWDIALESLFHDLLYRQQLVKRRVADQTLLSMMEDRGVPFAVRWMVYFGVRFGGWKAWKKWKAVNAAAKAAAEHVTEERIDTPSSLTPDKVE